MHLIELFLPLTDNEGNPFSRSVFDAIEKELADVFGGVTAYPRAPASGIWQQDHNHLKRDDLLVYEIMSEKIDREWWTGYREKLEQIFKQERILIRSQIISLL
jgi:hypothetical protein